jgi:hypothetical protein
MTNFSKMILTINTEIFEEFREFEVPKHLGINFSDAS